MGKPGTGAGHAGQMTRVLTKVAMGEDRASILASTPLLHPDKIGTATMQMGYPCSCASEQTGQRAEVRD